MTEVTENLLPTLDGCVHGVVGRDPWRLQCDGCGAIETPKILVLMQTKFIGGAQQARLGHPDPRRLCPDCQAAAGWTS